MSHHCHADGCDEPVPPAMFMCRRHWYMVPRPLQRAIWATYRRGQEIDKRPSDAYLLNADQAVRVVAGKEGRRLQRTGHFELLVARAREYSRGGRMADFNRLPIEVRAEALAP